MVRIITDSAADFEPHELAEKNIEYIPLGVSFGDDIYMEGIELTKEQFFNKLSVSNEIPKTSQATPYAFEQLLEKMKDARDDAIVITLSSKISGTYNNAVIAKTALEYDNCYIVDSLSATGGERIIVEEAVRLRDEGKNAREIVDHIYAIRPRLELYTCMNTIEYLYKGGRISKAAYLMCSVAGIKPIMTISKDGFVDVISKVLGMKRGIIYLYKKMKDIVPETIRTFYVMYINNRDVGIELAKYITKCCGLEIPDDHIIPVGAAIGAHIGPGACGITYIAK